MTRDGFKPLMLVSAVEPLRAGQVGSHGRSIQLTSDQSGTSAPAGVRVSPREKVESAQFPVPRRQCAKERGRSAGAVLLLKGGAVRGQVIEFWRAVEMFSPPLRPKYVPLPWSFVSVVPGSAHQ